MEYSELLAMLERIAPTILRQAKEMLREQQQREQAQEYVHSQREQEVQQQSATRKKKSWGLE